MKKHLFKRLGALVLSAALAFGMAGTGVLTAEAKSSEPKVKTVSGLWCDSVLYDMDTEKNILKVEVGTKFYVGDIVSATITYTNGLEGDLPVCALDGEAYKSSNSKIITVDKKTGLATPKKTGTAKVKVTYKKESIKVTVQVVKKGKFTQAGSKAKKAAAKLEKYSKAFTGEFNLNNAKKMIKIAKKCKAIVEPYYYEDYNSDRYAVEYGFGCKETDGYYNMTNELIYPGSLHFHAMDTIISSMIYVKYNPFYRHTMNPVTIKSATAKAGSNKATITLNRKITEQEYQMLAFSGDYSLNGKPNTYLYMESSAYPGYLIHAYGAVKKGSNKITVETSMAIDKDQKYYFPEYPTTTAADLALAEKLLTFSSGATYTLYGGETGFDEDGTIKTTTASKTWTKNYKLTVE